MNDTEDLPVLAREFFTVTRVPHDPLTKAFLNRCQSHTIKANGKFYKYYQSGSGPTVLHVHGVHSNLGSMVAIAEGLLEQGYQVVVFDAPAHGEALGTTTDPAEVRGLIRAIYVRFGELHAVVAHSLGGLWALSALNGSVRANAFVSISTPSTQRFLVDKFAEMNDKDDGAIHELTQAIESLLGDGVWSEYSPSELVANIGVPGLIIHGDADEFVPLGHAEQLHSCWPSSTVARVDGAGHFDIVGSPEVREIISRYLQDASSDAQVVESIGG
jgi:pimeloyl-ACP methyl ester carboxylesterase